MAMMRMIPTRTHAVMDYAIGALLIAAPWIFQFSDSTSAKWISIGVGISMLAASTMTDYEGGLMGVVPMPMHLMTDAALGVFLAISPWAFGFADGGANYWVPLLVIGIAEIGTAAMTQLTPADTRRTRRRRTGRRVRAT
jgi:hypothetical protein